MIPVSQIWAVWVGAPRSQAMTLFSSAPSAPAKPRSPVGYVKCTRRNRRGAYIDLQLTPKEHNMANICDMWYRYDPSVLIVAITWHETEVTFGEFLHTRLGLAYQSNQESVHAH